MRNSLAELFEGDAFVFGTDNRFQVKAQNRAPSTTLHPFNTVCFLRTNQGRSSGVLIAPRVVLTVKHSLFSNFGEAACGPMLSGPATKPLGCVAVYPGFDQSQPEGKRTIAVPESMMVAPTAQFAHPRLDLGLVILPAAFRGPSRFMLLQPRNDAETVNRAVTLAGYPGDMPRGTMWAHSDKVLKTSATHLIYQIDLCPGQSGGPVWLLGNAGTRILLAIQSVQTRNNKAPGQMNCGVKIPGTPVQNCGVRITCEAIRWILGVCKAASVQPPNIDAPTFRRCPAA